jgi:hypothetical protein
MEAVGDDADGAGGIAERQLCPGDRQVQDENAKENAGNPAGA